MNNTALLAWAVGALLVASLVLRFVLQPRTRHVDPQKRHRLFAVLLGIGVGSQAIGMVTAAVSDQSGAEIVFLLMGLLLGAACVVEMRKLRREF